MGGEGGGGGETYLLRRVEAMPIGKDREGVRRHVERPVVVGWFCVVDGGVVAFPQEGHLAL